jgi:hypothetical protein
MNKKYEMKTRVNVQRIHNREVGKSNSCTSILREFILRRYIPRKAKNRQYLEVFFCVHVNCSSERKEIFTMRVICDLVHVSYTGFLVSLESYAVLQF